MLFSTLTQQVFCISALFCCSLSSPKCTVQAISDDNFHVGFNNIYDKNLARSLRNIFKKHAHLFKGLEDKYDLDLAANCTTIRGFDDAITRRTFGRKLSLQCVVAGSNILSSVLTQNQCRFAQSCCICIRCHLCCR